MKRFIDNDNIFVNTDCIIHIIWMLAIWIWYKNILFRCVGSYSFLKSKWILVGFITMSCTVGLLLRLKKGNEENFYYDLAVGYGIYTVFAYMQIRKSLISVSLLLSAVFSFIFAILMMCRKIKNKRNAKKIVCSRLFKVVGTTWKLFGIGFAAIMLFSGINIISHSTIMKADSNINCITSDSFNIEAVNLLDDKSWVSLSVQDKINVLQMIANEQKDSLGISNELNVGAANLREGVKGCYIDNTYEIVIDLDCLVCDSSWETLDTISHEVYHCYQHRIVDALGSIDERNKHLKLFNDAAAYAEELMNYTDGEQDFCRYYNQRCEIDAREYAAAIVRDYRNKHDTLIYDT